MLGVSQRILRNQRLFRPGVHVPARGGIWVRSPDFILRVKTDEDGTSNNDQFTLPVKSGLTYDYQVEWGDGVVEEVTADSDQTHTYDSAGTYVVRVRGTFPRIYFNDGGDKLKVIELLQWGDIQWESLEKSFFGCANMYTYYTDAPNLDNVTTLKEFFRGCTVAQPNVGSWDVSGVQDMYGVFFGCGAANPDVSGWDVGNVTDMRYMFKDCSVANPDVSNWDMSNVIYLNIAFQGCSVANPDVSDWDTSSLVQAANVFYNCSQANPDMRGWDVADVTDFSNMCVGSNLSDSNYDALLLAWYDQDVEDEVSAHFGGAKYTAGGAVEDARDHLTDVHSWSITDGGAA